MAIDDLTNPFDQLTSLENAATAQVSPAATFGEQAAQATFRPEEVAREAKKKKGKTDVPLLLSGISDAFNKIFLGIDSDQVKTLQSNRQASARLELEQERLETQRNQSNRDRESVRENLLTTEEGKGGRQASGQLHELEQQGRAQDHDLDKLEIINKAEISRQDARIKGQARAQRASALFDDIRELTAFGFVLAPDLTDVDAVANNPDMMTRFLDASAGPRKAMVEQSMDNKARELSNEAWAASGATIAGVIAGQFAPNIATGQLEQVPGTSMAEKTAAHVSTLKINEITDEKMQEFVDRETAILMSTNPEFALAMHTLDPRLRATKQAELRNEIEKVYLKSATERVIVLQQAGAELDAQRQRGRVMQNRLLGLDAEGKPILSTPGSRTGINAFRG